MQMRKFDELISYFNRKVSDMDIDRQYKMELLGMVTALGYAHEKESEERKEGVESHSEKDILEGCIALLDEMVGYFSDYMEWLGYEPNEEERACGYFGMSYFKIVERLFLWKTNHSGGTSTREKCYELGIDDPSDGVRFALWDKEEGEADG